MSGAGVSLATDIAPGPAPGLGGSGSGSGGGGSDGDGSGDIVIQGNDLEALSCVSCRSRKLKCDRTKPACGRCTKLKGECVYPEARRKHTYKRRNVKELEERLAQVEVLLKDAKGTVPGSETNNVQDAGFPDSTKKNPSETPPINRDFIAGGKTPAASGMRYNHNTRAPSGAENAGGATSYELQGLGMFETLPPTEMIEELHHIYFTRQHSLVPMIHPVRYITSFYSAPHMRPPMALQYAIWTMATLGHEKYSSYHGVFHRRCRFYLEEDELRGDGEHFITIAHAQAWALIATIEARNMWFTRSAMSLGRCIKLIHMMGLHRLDDPNAELEMAPTIAPPKDWTELEERRRVFWGAFAMESHASVNTGWPFLIQLDEVTTHLPSSEEAFNQCREEKTCRLEDVFTGSHYSSFASSVIICYILNRIMKQVHHPKPDDCPQDFEYGKYWTRHRELDNLISSTFLFLPGNFCLPKNLKDSVAVHMNLNLHAATICLHNNAYEIAYQHNLPDHVKTTSKMRLIAAANEVVNIVKLTSHSNAGYCSPLISLALFVSSGVYILQAREEGLKPTDTANLEFLLTAMEAMGKQHMITMAFLRQAIHNIHSAGFAGIVRIPKLQAPTDISENGTTPAPCGPNVPLLARSRVTRNTDILPPLPGRLPLNKPIGQPIQAKAKSFGPDNPWNLGQRPDMGAGAQEKGNANKRKRVDLGSDPSSRRSTDDPSLWFHQSEPVDEVSSSDTTPGTTSLPSGSSGSSRATPGGMTAGNPDPISLPHRTGPTATGSQSTVLNGSSTPASSGIKRAQTTRSDTTGTMGPEGGSGVMPAEIFGVAGPSQANIMDLNIFQGMDGWDVTGGDVQGYAQATEGIQTSDFITALDDESWMVLNNAAGFGGSSWDANEGGTGVG